MVQHSEIAPKIDQSRWNRVSLLGNNNWRITLSPTMLKEFPKWSAKLAATGITWPNYQAGQLDWPDLTALAQQVRAELVHGTGVALLQGLQLEGLEDDQARLFLLMLCTQFGDTVDNYGRLYDVYDQGESYKDKAIPVSQTRESTTFHTDSAALHTILDVIGLLCLRRAKAGGESLVVSATDVHERMRSERSDLLAKLYEEYIRDIVTPGTEKNLERLLANRFPVFSYGRFAKGLSFRYMRYWIEKGHARAGRLLSPESLAALDYLDGLLSDPQQVVNFQMNPGDILLLNNHTIAHNRTAYEDFEESTKRRLLVRIWLKLRD